MTREAQMTMNDAKSKCPPMTPRPSGANDAKGK